MTNRRPAQSKPATQVGYGGADTLDHADQRDSAAQKESAGVVVQ